MTELKNLPELRAELDRVDTKDAIVVVYLDVGNLPPGLAMEYMGTVKAEMGKEIPGPVIWIPVRDGHGSKIEAMPKGRRGFYVDVGDMAPKDAIKYVQSVKAQMTKDIGEMPVLAGRGKRRDFEVIGESEMNDRGWYYYGVKRDGTSVA